MKRAPGRPAGEARAELEERGLLAVVAGICSEHGVTVDDVAGSSKPAPIARARQHVWHALRAVTTMSYSEIGALFGRDHSTVMAGIAACEARSRPISLAEVARAVRMGFQGMGAGAGI